MQIETKDEGVGRAKVRAETRCRVFGELRERRCAWRTVAVRRRGWDQRVR